MPAKKKTQNRSKVQTKRMVVPQTNDDMSFEDAWNEVSKSYMIGQLRHARPIAEKLYAVLKGEQDA